MSFFYRYLAPLVAIFMLCACVAEDVPSNTLRRPHASHNPATLVAATSSTLLPQAEPEEEKSQSELPVTPGGWNHIAVPYGERFQWSLTPEQAEAGSFMVTSVGTVFNDDRGLPMIIAGDYRVGMEAWCQDGPTFVLCADQPPQDLIVDIGSWSERGETHVVALVRDIPDDPQTFIDRMLLGEVSMPSMVLRHYIVEGAEWRVVQNVVLPEREEYANLWIGNMPDGDGYLDVIATTKAEEDSVGLQGGPEGFEIVEGYAPPGGGRGGPTLGAWHEGEGREMFMLSYGSGGSDRAPQELNSGHTCQIGVPGAWRSVPCNGAMSTAALMGGAMVGADPTSGMSLIGGDVGREYLEVPMPGSMGLLEPMGFESSVAKMGQPTMASAQCESGPYMTGWGVNCQNFGGETPTCFESRAFDFHRCETWDQPMTVWSVGADQWTLLEDPAFAQVNQTRGSITVDWGNGCPGLVTLPAYEEGFHPNTGIHVLTNDTCAEGGHMLELRHSESGQPAFSAIVAVYTPGGRYMVTTESGGGSGSHRSDAKFLVPPDATRVEVTWPGDGVTQVVPRDDQRNSNPWPEVLVH